jgi:cytochrome c peroxidase
MFKIESFVLLLVSIIALPLSLMFSADARAVLDPSTEADYNLKLLGKYVFFDKISEPQRMACVTCHEPTTGGTGGVSGVNLHQVVITGANPHTLGNLKPPTNAYASLLDSFHACGHGGLAAAGGFTDYCGGNFWSGRAEGNVTAVGAGSTKHIGDEIFYKGLSQDAALLGYAGYFGATADQALNPMPNVVEQNKQRQDVCLQVQASKFAPLYEAVWGEPIDCRNTAVDVHAPDVTSEKEYDISFKRLMLAVCAWQDSKDLNSFSSRRDTALRSELACACAEGSSSPNYPGAEVCSAVHGSPAVCDGTPGRFPLKGLTCQENYGHDLFYAGPNFGRPRATVPADRDGDCEQDVDAQGNPVFAFPAGCAFCHGNGGPAHDDGTRLDELYTAQDYHNIGVPFNPEIPDICFSGVVPCNPFVQPQQDKGIESHLQLDFPNGFYKTPTVRNVDKRKGNGFIKAYMHNGYFKSLERVVHFYNTAAVGLPTANSFGITRCVDTDGNPVDMTDKQAEANNCWPEPEFPETQGQGAIPFLVGNLQLTLEDEAALVAYMKTLTDTETATAPPPYKTATSTEKKK